MLYKCAAQFKNLLKSQNVSIDIDWIATAFIEKIASQKLYLYKNKIDYKLLTL